MNFSARLDHFAQNGRHEKVLFYFNLNKLLKVT